MKVGKPSTKYEWLDDLRCVAMSELIGIISQRDKLLDFMERYNLTGLCEATEEQLREYIKEVLQ